MGPTDATTPPTHHPHGRADAINSTPPPAVQVLDQRLEAMRAEKADLHDRFQDTVFRVQQKSR